jgi:hypothetical protein
MKTRALIVAAAVATTAFGRDAFTQSVSPHTGNTFGFMLGTEEVTGAIKSTPPGVIHPGVAIAALGQFPVARQLAIRADAMFHDIRDDGGGSSHMSYVISGSVAMVARLNSPEARWSPYILGGVGAYTYHFEDGRIVALRLNHFGLQGGVGFEMQPRATASRTGTIFVEARYMGIPPGGVVPLTIGMRF